MQNNINDTLKDSMLIFSINNNARTFPDVRTGLKPVGTRILYTMTKNNLGPNANRKKVNTIAGMTLMYHAHGDASVSDAMYKLSQPFYNSIPLMDPKGSVGTISGDKPAAGRYVEMRLSKYGADLCLDMNKNAVLWKANYDGTLQEPKFLPVKYPNLPINGSFGIGWGYTSIIPTHNFTEVCEMCIDLINDPSIPVREVAECLLPDFPTGGVVINKDEVISGYETGSGRIVLRAKITRDEDEHQLIVTEIPFMKNTGDITEKIVEKIKTGKLLGIVDIFDRSKNDDVQIILKCAKGSDLAYIESQLYSMTPLEDTQSFNFMCQEENSFRQYNIKELLTAWIDFRKITIQRIYNYDIEKLNLRCHIIDGLLIAIKDIDAVIELIKTSETSEDVITNLIKNFKGITRLQAENISEMKLKSLASLGAKRLKDEKDTKQAEITRLIKILSDPEELNQIIIDELDDGINKYGRARRTDMLNMSANSLEVLDESYIVYLTEKGNIKKVNEKLDTVKSKTYGGKMYKDDYVIQRFESHSSDILLVFTDKGKLYTVNNYELPVSDMSLLGYSIIAHLKLKDENIIKIIPLNKADYTKGKYNLLFVTKYGSIKRTHADQFRNINKGGLIAIRLGDKDVLKDVVKIEKENLNNDVILITKKGIGTRFDINDIPKLLRATKGVTAISLQPSDEVAILKEYSETNLILISKRGVTKVLDNSSIVKQKRAGKGRSVIILSENDEITNALFIKDPKGKVKTMTTKKVITNKVGFFGKAEARGSKGNELIPLDRDENVIMFVME